MQNDSIDNLRLDLNKKSVRGVIYVRVGDTRARTVHITLTSNGKVVDLSDAAICEILIRKPDGSQNDQATINEQAMVQYGNELQYTFRTQDINVPGECHCQVMVTFKDGAVVTSPDFSVMVYEKEVSQEYEQSTNEYTAITQQLINVMELRNQTAVDAERAETARENIEDIEASCEVAKGQVEELTNRAETAAQSAEASAQSAADDLQATQNYRNEALNYKEETDTNRQAVNDKAEEILSYEYQAQQYALSAEASATSASASESSAQTSADSAESDAISSRSYAKGGTGTRTGEDVDNSKYYYEQARDIAEGLQGALLPQGTITFAQLDNVTVIAGYEWNISDDFVSDSRFNDGGGVQYAAGTNVYVTMDLKLDCLTGSAVTGVKGSAESTYRKGYVEIDKEDIGLSNVDNTSDASKPISTAQQAALDNKVSKTGDTMSGNFTIDKADGTTSTIGSSVFVVGNNTASGTEGNSRGTVYIYDASAYSCRLRPAALTASRKIDLPDKNGIVALTSDIPTDFVSRADGGTFSGNVTVNRANGTTSSVGTSYLVLGNSTASGTANNSKGILWIYGKGSNYATISATDITANRGFELPNKGGTIALTSDIPSTTSSSTTHGTLYKYGKVRVWQSGESSATSIAIPSTYTWGSEIASGDRPSYTANIHGCTLDSNGNVTGDISGAIGTNGTMTFRTSNGSTGNYYLRMTCMWIVG
jgi:hypothetical protein